MDNHEALQIELKLLKGWEAANIEERELTPDEQKYYEAYIIQPVKDENVN